MSAVVIGWAAALGIGMGLHAMGVGVDFSVGIALGTWFGFTAGVYVRSQVRLP